MTGDLDLAMRWYRRALELREPQFPRVPYANPQLTNLFADPRWKALLRGARDSRLGRGESGDWLRIVGSRTGSGRGQDIRDYGKE